MYIACYRDENGKICSLRKMPDVISPERFEAAISELEPDHKARFQVVEIKEGSFEHYLFSEYQHGYSIAMEVIKEKQALEKQLVKAPEHSMPLTLEQLEQMTGEPVWVVTSNKSEWCLIQGSHGDDIVGKSFSMIRRTGEERLCPHATYGQMWQAYNKKPSNSLL